MHRLLENCLHVFIAWIVILGTFSLVDIWKFLWKKINWFVNFNSFSPKYNNRNDKWIDTFVGEKCKFLVIQATKLTVNYMYKQILICWSLT